MSHRIFMALLIIGLSGMTSPASVADSTGTTQSARVIPDDQPFEFRGVLEEGGDTIFSIYDAVAHRSLWIGLHKPAYGFRIDAYDERQNLITLVHQEKSSILPLKGGAKRIQMPEQPATNPASVQKSNEYHDKPFRIGHVFEETLIRRAVRQAGEPATRPAVAPEIPVSR